MMLHKLRSFVESKPPSLLWILVLTASSFAAMSLQGDAVNVLDEHGNVLKYLNCPRFLGTSAPEEFDISGEVIRVTEEVLQKHDGSLRGKVCYTENEQGLLYSSIFIFDRIHDCEAAGCKYIFNVIDTFSVYVVIPLLFILACR